MSRVTKQMLKACCTLKTSKSYLLCMGNFLKIGELVMALFLLSGCHTLISFYCCSDAFDRPGRVEPSLGMYSADSSLDVCL